MKKDRGREGGRKGEGGRGREGGRVSTYLPCLNLSHVVVRR